MVVAKNRKTGIFKYFHFAFFVLLLYAFTFQPILSKYMYIGIELVFVAIFFMKHGTKRFFSTLRVEILLLSVITFYSLFLDLFTGEMVYFDRFAACLFHGTAVAYCISKYVKNHQYLDENFDNATVAMAAIAGIITVLMLLIPSFDSLVKSFTPEDFERLDRFEQRYRLYGLSENLSFTYPYVLAVVGFFVIVKKKIYVSLPLVLLVIITVSFNARIGFIPLLLSFVYIPFVEKRSMNTLIKYIISVIAIFIIYLTLVSRNDIFYSQWGMSFFDEIEGLLQGGESKTYDNLTGTHMFLPDESVKDFLLGTGISVYYQSQYSRHSDIGYVIQLYYGGMFLFSLIISLMFYMSRRIINLFGFRHWFTFIYITSIIILNFKGFYFASTPGFRFLTLLYVYFLVSVEERNRTRNLVLRKRAK